jgi:hypothetical protein
MKLIRRLRCRILGHRPDEADVMVAALKRTALYVVNPVTSIRCRWCGEIMGTIEVPR